MEKKKYKKHGGDNSVVGYYRRQVTSDFAKDYQKVIPTGFSFEKQRLWFETDDDGKNFVCWQPKFLNPEIWSLGDILKVYHCKFIDSDSVIFAQEAILYEKTDIGFVAYLVESLPDKIAKKQGGRWYLYPPQAELDPFYHESNIEE